MVFPVERELHNFKFDTKVQLGAAVTVLPHSYILKDGPPSTPVRRRIRFKKIMRVHRSWRYCHYLQLLLLFGITAEGYLLTPASRLLLKDEPLSVTPFLLAMLDPILTKPWHHVKDWFQNDDPTPFHTVHGSTFWDYAGREPHLNRFFNEAMASDARLVTSVVIKDCKGVFEGLESLVDVGGGTGTVAKAIGDAFPKLKCVVLDLPHVVAGLEGSGNLEFVGGDIMDAIPPVDAVLLKWILHDWSDEECVKILKCCKEAIPSKGGKVIPSKGGKVIIIDMKVDNNKGADDESIETQLFFDMLMMILVTGRERTEGEWAKLFFEAGFSDYKITPILGLRSLIEVFP